MPVTVTYFQSWKVWSHDAVVLVRNTTLHYHTHQLSQVLTSWLSLLLFILPPVGSLSLPHVGETFWAWHIQYTQLLVWWDQQAAKQQHLALPKCHFVTINAYAQHVQMLCQNLTLSYIHRGTIRLRICVKFSSPVFSYHCNFSPTLFHMSCTLVWLVLHYF